MDVKYRDVYEAAHSAVLSLFNAAPPSQSSHADDIVRSMSSAPYADKALFIRGLVPGYVDCLMKVSIVHS